VNLKFPKHKGGLYLTHNNHKGSYETAKERIEKYEENEIYDLSDWKDKESRQRAIDTDEIWDLQWYPDTPVGSYKVLAPTLEELLELALEVEAGYLGKPIEEKKVDKVFVITESCWADQRIKRVFTTKEKFDEYAKFAAKYNGVAIELDYEEVEINLPIPVLYMYAEVYGNIMEPKCDDSYANAEKDPQNMNKYFKLTAATPNIIIKYSKTPLITQILQMDYFHYRATVAAKPNEIEEELKLRAIQYGINTRMGYTFLVPVKSYSNILTEDEANFISKQISDRMIGFEHDACPLAISDDQEFALSDGFTVDILAPVEIDKFTNIIEKLQNVESKTEFEFLYILANMNCIEINKSYYITNAILKHAALNENNTITLNFKNCISYTNEKINDKALEIFKYIMEEKNKYSKQ
jgi:hypothetical protein